MKVLTTPRSYGKTDPEVFAMLRAAGLEVVRNETGGILDKEGMKALLADCDGVIVGVDPIDAEVIAAAPKLKAIAKYGVGVTTLIWTPPRPGIPRSPARWAPTPRRWRTTPWPCSWRWHARRCSLTSTAARATGRRSLPGT